MTKTEIRTSLLSHFNVQRKPVLDMQRDPNADYAAEVIDPKRHSLRLVTLLARLQSVNVNVDVQDVAFFLASMDRSFRPLLVFVRKGEEYIGLVFVKEKLFCGVGSQIAYIDLSVRQAAFTAPGHLEEVVAETAKALFEHCHMLSLRLLATDNDWNSQPISQLAQRCSIDFRSATLNRHVVLPLASRYEDVLKSIGTNARQNLRKYRRRSEAASHQFRPALSLSEFLQGGLELVSQKTLGATAYKLERVAGMLSLASHPILMGLQTEHGKWISLLGGWKQDDTAVVFFQLNNDRRYASFSPAAVMRTHLIETLIAQGAKRIIFWAGLYSPFKSACEPLHTTCLYLDRRDVVWRCIRNQVSSLSHLVPHAKREVLRWIVPLPEAPISESALPRS